MSMRKLINNLSKGEMENLIQAKLRIITPETVSQRALRTVSELIRGEVSIYVVRTKWVCAVNHTAWQKVAASHEEQIS